MNLLSSAKNSLIGLRTGEYGGRYKNACLTYHIAAQFFLTGEMKRCPYAVVDREDAGSCVADGRDSNSEFGALPQLHSPSCCASLGPCANISKCWVHSWISHLRAKNTATIIAPELVP